MKTIIARVLLPFVFIGLCVMPAYAFLPGAVAPIVYGGGSSAGAAVGGGASGWGLLLGTIFTFIGVSDSTGEVRIPTTDDPALAVPPPDVPDTVSPALGTKYQGSGYFYDVTLYDTAQEACQSQISHQWPTGGYTACVMYGYLCGRLSGSVCDTGIAVAQQIQSADCPDGYALSGDVCQLVDPRVAQPDDKCDYARSASALAVLSDPDCSGGGGGGDGVEIVTNPDGSVSITGSNPDTGYDRMIEIRPTTDGGSVVIIRDESLIGNTTVTDSTTVTVGPDGAVGSVSGETNTGGLPAPGTNPTGDPVAPIVFPNDYARTGEAQTAADSLAPKLDRLHDDLSLTQTVNDPTQLTEADMPGFGSTFDALRVWAVPGHASTCPAPSLDLSGVDLGVHVMDAHCQLVTDHFVALEAAMIAAWSLLALFVVLRA